MILTILGTARYYTSLALEGLFQVQLEVTILVRLSILVLQIGGSFLLVALEGTSRHKALMDVTLRLLHLVTCEIRLRVHPELLAIWERH